MIDQKALDEAVALELELMKWARMQWSAGLHVAAWQIDRAELPRIIRNYRRIVAQRIQTGSQ